MDQLKKIQSLDVLRGLLALIVCVAHSGNMHVGDVSPYLGLSARLSVLCFFALSGFVIAGSLERNHEKNGWIDLRDFFLQRFFRVIPPLLGVFLLLVLVEIILNLGGFTPAGHGGKMTDFHLNILKVTVSLFSLGAIGDLTGGLDGPLWSLRYEMRSYLTAGLLAWAF